MTPPSPGVPPCLAAPPVRVCPRAAPDSSRPARGAGLGPPALPCPRGTRRCPAEAVRDPGRVGTGGTDAQAYLVYSERYGSTRSKIIVLHRVFKAVMVVLDLCFLLL